MKKLITSLALLPLLAALALAQQPCPNGQCPAPILYTLPPSAAAEEGLHAPVAVEHRSRNMTGVQCAWASLRTMALRAGLGRLAARCEGMPGPLWSPAEIEAACRECGVAVERVGPGDHEQLFAFLEKHVAKGGRPAWIGVQHGRHALLCVHFERGKRVKLLGNSTTPYVFEFDWGQFLDYGPDGLAFALPADTATPAAKKEPAKKDAAPKKGAEAPKAAPVTPTVPAPAPMPPVVALPPRVVQDCPNGVCPAPRPRLLGRVFWRR